MGAREQRTADVRAWLDEEQACQRANFERRASGGDVRPIMGASETGKVRQTACRYCELDIEGFWPYRRGEWRDRGNNTHCPLPDGKTGHAHAPTKDA